MVIEMPYCDFKCDRECGHPVCQNSNLASAPNIRIDVWNIVDKYINNPITEAIVFQGLEPFFNYFELKLWIETFRKCTNDDIVIYTGYNKDEIQNFLTDLTNYTNIIIKYGRFIPNQKSHYDTVLGVNLASENQYAEKIS